MVTRSMEQHYLELGKQFKTRAEGEDLFIEGYFAVFNKEYELPWGEVETIARGAFIEAIQRDDVRALINHDSTLVLGRNTNGTLTLKEDDTGLWGSVKVNPKDQDAMNAYSRVERGDVSQCSFGFEILDEDNEVIDGVYHYTIKRVKLYEVSICTFPAYEDTEVKARNDEYRQKRAEAREKEKAEKWKAEMLERVKKC